MEIDDTLKLGILTVSDRASRGEYEDRGGPAIREYFERVLTSPFEPVYEIVPDVLAQIKATIRRMTDRGCQLIVTTGGTGPALRDVTPEATEQVCDRMMPGFGELMRAVSLNAVPTAILSRQTAGLLGETLIINLPGNPKAIAECLDAVMPAVPYCLDLMEGPFVTTDEAHVKAFRPKPKL